MKSKRRRSQIAPRTTLSNLVGHDGTFWLWRRDVRCHVWCPMFAVNSRRGTHCSCRPLLNHGTASILKRTGFSQGNFGSRRRARFDFGLAVEVSTVFKNKEKVHWNNYLLSAPQKTVFRSIVVARFRLAKNEVLDMPSINLPTCFPRPQRSTEGSKESVKQCRYDTRLLLSFNAGLSLRRATELLNYVVIIREERE